MELVSKYNTNKNSIISISIHSLSIIALAILLFYLISIRGSFFLI